MRVFAEHRVLEDHLRRALVVHRRRALEACLVWAALRLRVWAARRALVVHRAWVEHQVLVGCWLQEPQAHLHLGQAACRAVSLRAAQRLADGPAHQADLIEGKEHDRGHQGFGRAD